MKSKFEIGEDVNVKDQYLGKILMVNGAKLTVQRDRGTFNPSLRGLVVMLKQDIFSITAANGKRLYLEHVCTEDDVNMVTDQTEKEETNEPVG